ncbi:hypothetical protein H0A70_05315 [Alcaligenaceae bacterium]|nr:hypothetical protein [Alcaligenaceae bacterium]
MTQVVQFPSMTNPSALSTVDELRAALESANAEIMNLALRNSMLEMSVSYLGNDIADVAQAFSAGDMDQLLPVLQRISTRVAATKTLAQAAQQAKAAAERAH